MGRKLQLYHGWKGKNYTMIYQTYGDRFHWVHTCELIGILLRKLESVGSVTVRLRLHGQIGVGRNKIDANCCASHAVVATGNQIVVAPASGFHHNSMLNG